MGIHPGQTGNLLSGVPIQQGAIVHGGISMDQVLANSIGQDTPQSSLVLACEQPMTGYHETNFSMAYSSHISWQSADSPVPERSLSVARVRQPVREPRQPAQSEHPRPREGPRRDAQPQVSSTDKAKLDEYLTSVREVEKRIERMRNDKDKAERPRSKGRPLLHDGAPDNGLPEDLREHTRLMCDIIAMAFQTDKTRIASLLLCRDLSGAVLSVPRRHEATTTRASHDDLSDGYERDHALPPRASSPYLAKKLDAMPEGEGTVLDNCCLHVPLEHVGRLEARQHEGARGHRRRPGRHAARPAARSITCTPATSNRKLCSLYLAIMDRMGVKLDRFGDAGTRLTDL